LNNPPYYIEDVFKALVEEDLKEDLSLSNARFDYGYVEEINEKLKLMNDSEYEKKYPLFWLVSPFTETKGESLSYFSSGTCRILIVASSATDSFSDQRYKNNLRGYLELLCKRFFELLEERIEVVRVPEGLRKRTETFRPFWGQSQKSVFDDKVDVLEISFEIQINNNLNC